MDNVEPMGLDYGDSYKISKRHSKRCNNGVHYMDEAGFWIMRHFIKGNYTTLKGKFKTEKEAEKAYDKWVKSNCA